MLPPHFYPTGRTGVTPIRITTPKKYRFEENENSESFSHLTPVSSLFLGHILMVLRPIIVCYAGFIQDTMTESSSLSDPTC